MLIRFTLNLFFIKLFINHRIDVMSVEEILDMIFILMMQLFMSDLETLFWWKIYFWGHFISTHFLQFYNLNQNFKQLFALHTKSFYDTVLNKSTHDVWIESKTLIQADRQEQQISSNCWYKQNTFHMS